MKSSLTFEHLYEMVLPMSGEDQQRWIDIFGMKGTTIDVSEFEAERNTVMRILEAMSPSQRRNSVNWRPNEKELSGIAKAADVTLDEVRGFLAQVKMINL